ncbi:MAG TPA: hypothetical protein DCQ98_16005, partial [Planctomycetaceae bacterium]|nr:hypothetical protein [Planctomycetaceae bacterium]
VALHAMTSDRFPEEAYQEWAGLVGEIQKKLLDKMAHLVPVALGGTSISESGGGQSRKQRYGEHQSTNFKEAEYMGHPVAILPALVDKNGNMTADTYTDGETGGGRGSGNLGGNFGAGSSDVAGFLNLWSSWSVGCFMGPDKCSVAPAFPSGVIGQVLRIGDWIDTIIGAVKATGIDFKNMAKVMRALGNKLADNVGAGGGVKIDRLLCPNDVYYFFPYYLSGVDALFWRSGAPITELLTLAGRDRSTAVPLPELETHLARIASEAPIDADPIIDFLARSLRSESRDVRAAAADAVASAARRRADGSPSDAIDRSDAFLPVLLDSLIETAEDDPMLRQGLRIAIKETLRGWPSERLPQLLGKDVRRRSELASVALAVPTEVGAAVLHEAAIGSDLGESQVEAWRRIAAHGAPELLERLPTEIPARFADDPGVQFELLAAVQRGLRDRGLAARSMLADWGRTLATTLLDENAAQGGWTNAPIPGAARRENPWTLERRRSADEVETDFLTTLAVGESSVGRLRSPRFVAAERFEFWCAGHCGYPDRPFAPKNFVRLIDANDGSVLIESTPPRNDVAQRIEWETSAFAGREVRFEAIDADEAGAYAWLSVGRFDPKLLPAPGTPSDTAERVVRGALLIRELGLVDLRSLLLAQVEGAEIDGQARTAAVEACAAVRPDPVVALIAPWIGSGRVGETWRQRSLARLASGPAEEQDAETEARRALIDPLLVSLDATEQGTLAERGVASAEGLALLVDLWERGRLSTRMLGNRQFLDRATAIADPAQRQQIEGWQSLLPPLDEAIAMTLADRREAFRSRGGSSQRGAEVFGKHCAACHQIAGQGAVVGPQLDGVGLRGLERLSEDLLDPNRNVDVAFRPTIVETEDGSTLSGLIRSENGSTVVLVDSLGKEIVVDVASIVQRQPSTLSLMPETLGRDLPEQELLDLFAYLLDQKQAVER